MLALGILREEDSQAVPVRSVHSAKFYKISLNGWMYLILNHAFAEQFYLELVLRYAYNKNVIFSTFLYPLFELETLTYLDSFDVSAYLAICCEKIIHYVKIRERACDLHSRKIITTPMAPLCPFRNRGQNYEDYPKKSTVIVSRRPRELSGWFVRIIIEQLDLHVKLFLFQQIMKYHDKPKVGSILSKDKKFMSAIEGTGQDITRIHDILLELRENS